MSFADTHGKEVYAVGTLVTSLLAVHYIAHRNQAIRLSGATLPQPVRPKPHKNVTAKPKEAPASFARRTGNATWSLIKFLVPMFAPAFLLVYILPRIASQVLVDGVVLTALAYFVHMINSGGWTVFENGVTWAWGSTDACFLVISISPRRDRWAASAFGVSFTAISIAMAYFDLNYLSFILLAPPLAAMTIVPGFPCPRGLCFMIAIIMGVLAALGTAVLGGRALWHLYDVAGSPIDTSIQSTNSIPNMPSEWIFSMLSPMMFFPILFFATSFLSITLLFDCSQSGNVRLLEEMQETEKIVFIDDKPIARIQRNQSNPSTPLYNTGMIGLAAAHLIAYFIVCAFPPAKKSDEIMFFQVGVYTSVMTVPGCIALHAWMSGKFAEWFDYEDPSRHRLCTDETEVDTQAMDDVENLLNEK